MKTILLILLLLHIFISPAQIPEIQWQYCYGTFDIDYSFTIANTENGYMIATEVRTGQGLTNYHGLYDIWIIMTDTLGNIIWEKCYGGTNHDTPRKINKTSNNNYYLLCGTMSNDGDVSSFNHGESDLWVVKINEQGDILWEKCYGSPGPDDPRDMILTPDGGFLLLCRVHIAGGDVSQYYGSWDNWMCKCDSLGNIEWEKTLGNQWLDSGMSMIINSEGNIMMIGAAAHTGGIVDCSADDGYGDVWLVELDMSGEILWQQCYGGSFYELGTNIKELNDGYVFAAGSNSNDGDVSGHHGPAGNPPDGWGDYWIVKIGDTGEIIWQKSLGGYNGDDPYYITQIEDGGFMVFGTTWSHYGDVSGNHSMPGGYDTDLWVVKLSSEGEIEWQKCYGGWGSERLETPHTILKKGDNNYVIASSTDYKSGNDDIQCDIHANWDRDVWVFEIEDTNTNIIYTQTTDNAIKVYPNPATDYVIFELHPSIIPNHVAGIDAGVRNPYNLQITNIFGLIVENNLPITNGMAVWDCSKINPGLYFYRLYNNEEIKTGKIIIH